MKTREICEGESSLLCFRISAKVIARRGLFLVIWVPHFLCAYHRPHHREAASYYALRMSGAMQFFFQDDIEFRVGVHFGREGGNQLHAMETGASWNKKSAASNPGKVYRGATFAYDDVAKADTLIPGL